MLLQLVISMKEQGPFGGEGRTVRAVALEELDAERGLGVFHDSPGFAVGHVHLFCRPVQRTPLLHAATELSDAASEYGAVLSALGLQAELDARGDTGDIHASS